MTTTLIPDVTICNVCDNPNRTLSDAHEVVSVRCNVRQFEDQTFTVWRCPQCKSLHSKEGIDLSFYYQDYPFKKHTMKPGLRVAYTNRLNNLVKQGLQKTDRILDYGCGRGLFVTFLKERGYDAYGYDAFTPGWDDPQVLKDPFNVIVSQDVIEHVEDPKAFMAEQAACLASGGLAVVGTPNAADIDLNQLDRYLLELHQPYHRHILSEDALVNLGQQSGLQIQHVDHRFYSDTPVPFVNQRFLWKYVEANGNNIDTFFEDKPLFSSPELLGLALFGYYLPFPQSGHMIAYLRK